MLMLYCMAIIEGQGKGSFIIFLVQLVYFNPSSSSSSPLQFQVALTHFDKRESYITFFFFFQILNSVLFFFFFHLLPLPSDRRDSLTAADFARRLLVCCRVAEYRVEEEAGGLIFHSRLLASASSSYSWNQSVHSMAVQQYVCGFALGNCVWLQYSTCLPSSLLPLSLPYSQLLF